jgi:hypothetical protein
MVKTRKLNDSSLSQFSVEGKKMGMHNDSFRASLNRDIQDPSEKASIASPNPEFETFESRF